MEQAASGQEWQREEALGVFKGLVDHLGISAVKAHLTSKDDVLAKNLNGIVIPDEEGKYYVLIGAEGVRFRMGEWAGYSLSFEDAEAALAEVEAEAA